VETHFQDFDFVGSFLLDNFLISPKWIKALLYMSHYWYQFYNSVCNGMQYINFIIEGNKIQGNIYSLKAEKWCVHARQK